MRSLGGGSPCLLDPYIAADKPLNATLAPQENIIVHMVKKKKKMTVAQKAAKKKRQKEYMTIFMHGKQKRVKRPPTINGIPVDEFIRQNADPIWLHQNEIWEYIEQPEDESKN